MVQRHINIYCDESRHTSNPEDAFMVIGALACGRDKSKELSRSINMLRKKHNIWREFGWKTLSPSRRDFYWELIDLFRSEDSFAFRCLVADRGKFDHDKHNLGDSELGFYKLYYQTLVHWLKPENIYHIYLDWQLNQERGRFATLRDILKRKLTGKAKIACLEPIGSHTQNLIQLSDLITGAVGYAWNDKKGSSIKLQFCEDIALSAGLPRLNISTASSAEKFNVFHFTGR